MKKVVLLVFALSVMVVLQAQSSFHNYFSQTTGDYVQVGYCNGYILYRYPTPTTQFTRLNYLGAKGGLNYYGSDSFQVAALPDGSRVCVITLQYTNWYNYCGPVPAPNPNLNSNPSPNYSSSKCPWCNGTGRIAKNDHVPQYGMNSYDKYVKCPECGTTYNAVYTNHYHLNCGKCGGTGRLSR